LKKEESPLDQRNVRLQVANDVNDNVDLFSQKMREKHSYQTIGVNSPAHKLVNEDSRQKNRLSVRIQEPSDRFSIKVGKIPGEV